MNFIIAENAAEGFWDKHYDVDPGVSGLHHVYSAHRTIEGSSVQKIYTESEFKKAVADCVELNKRFPNKGHAVVRAL